MVRVACVLRTKCLVPAIGYLSTMCQLIAENPGRRYLRSAARADLAVPVTCTTTTATATTTNTTILLLLLLQLLLLLPFQ